MAGKKQKRTVVSVEVESLKGLTSLERMVLQAVIDGLYAEPGFSDVDCADVAKATGMKVRSVVGVVGSLVKKEYLDTEFTSRFRVGGSAEWWATTGSTSSMRGIFRR